MNEKKDIITKNANGEYHGYQEWYNGLGNLGARSQCKNHVFIGYHEWHVNTKITKFFIR